MITDGKFNGKVQFNLRLLKESARTKKPQVIAPWNDLYALTDGQIIESLQVMRDNPRHTYLIITKRIENAARFWKRFKNLHMYLTHGNIWTIPTCENQAMVDKRIPHLLRIPGKRGIIIEPMLEGMILQGHGEYGRPDALRGRYYLHGKPGDSPEHQGRRIHQVILGPENGPGKRPFDPAWADSIKAQCEAAGVPFYRKDTGDGTLAWRSSD